MKKMIAALSTIAILCACSACKKAPSPAVTIATTQSATTETVSDTTTTPTKPIVSQLPMYAISLPTTEEEVCAEDGTVIFKNTYRNISLVIPDQEVADKIIIDYLRETDTRDRASSILEAAKDTYQHGNASTLPYMLTSNYAPTRIDQSILSLFGNVTEYTGGAHGNDIACSATYDMTTGTVMNLQDILCESVTADQFVDLILKTLSESTAVLFEGYEQTVKDLYSNGFPRSNEWYLDTDGLCCYFSPYTIGPYASGIVIAKIPYASLTGILKDDYFPREWDHHEGTLQCIPFNDSMLSSFTQITELTLSDDGDMYILYTDGLICNITISKNVASHGSSGYALLNTIFAANSLTPGDAIVIKADELSNLSSTYTRAGQQETIYLD